MRIARSLVGWALVLSAGAAEPAAAGQDRTPLGSPDFRPSPERPVGWRGDGTGHYPGATPPTTWSRSATGEKKNILWETKLPCYSWATPIIVGERIYVRSEPYDLICLDKNTGKVLWIRSHPPFVTVPDEERRAQPAFAEIEPLVAELKKVNDAFAAQGWTQALFKQKYDLQKKINDLTGKADRKYKLPPDMWVESWSGYTAATPCSDGKFIYILSGSGVVGCFDLDGNPQWTKFHSCAEWWGEHGDPTSPALVGGKLLKQGPMALDAATGKELWSVPLVSSRGGGYAFVPFRSGAQDFAVIGNQFIRVSDGKSVFNTDCHVATTPVPAGNEVYLIAATYLTRGYRCEPQDAGGLKVTTLKPVELPGPADPTKKWEPTADFYTAAPLYHDGLMYVVGNWGKLSLTDMRQGTLVYSMQAPFAFKNGFHRKSYGTGIGAGLAMAGRYIYLTDNAGCTLVMEPGREFKLVAKNELDYVHPQGWEGWERRHWEGPRHEVTLSTPVFEGSRMYLRGEQNLYCIGEK